VCREDGQKNVVVVGLKERQVENVDQLLEAITYGNGIRSTGVTGANIDSSRSHAILQIQAKKMVKKKGEQPRQKAHGKFSFIDLAGSERAADTTNNDRQTRYDSDLIITAMVPN
jgi:kinesin family protein 2/24